jgi:hypothetical protein
LLVLYTLGQHHPHARQDGTAPAAAQNAAALALAFRTVLHRQLEHERGSGDGVVTHAIVAHVQRLGGADATPEEAARAQIAATKQVVLRLGWVRDDAAVSGGSRGSTATAPEEAATRRVRITTSCDPRRADDGDCAGCGRMRRTGEGAFAKCARCKAAPYCSKACQAAHWKTHKKACKAAPGAA